MIRFRCSNCKAKMEVDDTFGGRAARCPTCGSGLRVPKAAPDAATPGGTSARPGATTVDVEGEKVEILPPIELTAIVSVVIVGLSVVAFVIGWLVRVFNFTDPFQVGAAMGALVALLGVFIAVWAYPAIKKSRGRKRGLPLVRISLLGGLGLFLVFLSCFIAAWAMSRNRPPCEENLSHIYSAIRSYCGDHNGVFPPSLSALVKDKYLDNMEWLRCSAYKVEPGSVTYSMTPDVNMENKLYTDHPDMMIVFDGPGYEQAHQDGLVRILLLNGNVEKIPFSQWQKFRDGQEKIWQEIKRKLNAPPLPPVPAAALRAPTPEGAAAPPVPTPGAAPAPAPKAPAPAVTPPAPAPAPKAPAPAAAPAGGK